MEHPQPRAQAGGRRSPFTPPNVLSLTAWLFGATALLLLLLGLVVAIAVPFGAYDALSLGVWSRLIGEHLTTFHFDPIGAPDYQRPVYFVLQGVVWRVFGFHQALGRLLSFGFALVLVGTVGSLARRTVAEYRALSATLAVLLLLTVTYFENYEAAGLTDIPVAAMVGVTAVVLVARRLGRAQLPLLAVASLLTVLTKPSSLPALIGLGGAVLLGSRSGLRRRAYSAAALGVGAAIALIYDFSQARFLHQSLYAFLTLDTPTHFYANLADQNRRQVLLDGSWLGPDLRSLLWFAIAYAIVRLLVSSHRLAVAIALPVAVIWSWLGPHLAGTHGVRAGILGIGGGAEQAAVLLLTASLLFAFAAPANAIPDRLRLARLLVWAVPTIVIWGMDAVYDARLLAPAWPPLVLLITWTFLPAFAGARQRRGLLIVLPTAAMLTLGVLAVYGINGFGRTGWQQFRSGGLSGLTNTSLMRNVGLGGDFSVELDALDSQVRSGDSILTYDGRLRFYYGDQIDYQQPLSCSQLAGHRVFVLLEDDEYETLFGARAGSAFWDACRSPSLTKVAERPGAFAVYVIGTPRASTGGCSARGVQDSGMAIEFGRVATAAKAAALKAHVVAAGFVEAKTEQLGCSLYRVVETGVPSTAVGQSIVAEAKSAGIVATLVPR